MNNLHKDPSRFRQSDRTTASELDFRLEMNGFIEKSSGTYYEKMENFPKYVSRQSFARYLALYEIFKQALDVQGDIIECGVNWGGGLMCFALLTSVLEPVNIQRRIIGFDTFAGFVEVSEQDRNCLSTSSEMKKGGFAAGCYDELLRCIQLYDSNRFIGHIGKVELVQGDANTKIPDYLAQNPQTVVSILHLDFDLYQPTKVAIENFVPRMPKGGIVIFDELNNKTWPGETVATIEALGINNLRLRRFTFEPHISYAILE